MSTVANAAAEARAAPGSEDILGEARRVLRMEAEAVAALGGRLGEGFLRAVDLISSRGTGWWFCRAWGSPGSSPGRWPPP